MKYLLLGLVLVAFVFVIYLAWWGDAASPLVIGVYIIASLAALATRSLEPRWSGGIKWIWVVVSFVTIAAIFTGPLDYLRLT